MAGAPPLAPSSLDVLSELWAAAQIAIIDRPIEYQGRVRQLGQLLENWYTNVAYWVLYPEGPVTIGPSDAAATAAWSRLQANVQKFLYPITPQVDTGVVWPLPTAPPATTSMGSRFMAKRPAKGTQTRYHTGQDYAAKPGTSVLSPENGVVLASNSGWESEKSGDQVVGVKAIVITSDSGFTWLLGGIRPSSGVATGTRVSAGQRVAEIGTYPGGDSMLHVTLYEGKLTREEVEARKQWRVGFAAPKGLVDPVPRLLLGASRMQARSLMAAPLETERMVDSEQNEGGELLSDEGRTMLAIATFASVAIAGALAFQGRR
jgi:murein DD-endopeptidase MepM/ murein hydrolase activator NlpD